MGLRDRFGRKQETAVDETAEHQPQAGPGEVGNANAELRNFRKQHRWDPFLEIDKLDNIDSALESGNAEKQAAIDESLIQENSPYAEVRAAVRNIWFMSGRVVIL